MEPKNEGYPIVNKWFDEHADYLLNFALTYTRDRELAKDLLQDTFLAALEHGQNFKKESSPKTWLTAILRNKLLNRLKRDQRNESLDPTQYFFSEQGEWLGGMNQAHNWQSPDVERLDDPDFLRKWHNCLDNLQPIWRSVVLMRIREEAQPKTICKDLGVSMSNYWQIMHRAKLALSKCLANGAD